MRALACVRACPLFAGREVKLDEINFAKPSEETFLFACCCGSAGIISYHVAGILQVSEMCVQSQLKQVWPSGKQDISDMYVPGNKSPHLGAEHVCTVCHPVSGALARRSPW